MENRFNNRDFEQFVKQNADQYRMFPSEKVWENIHGTLHVRKRWYGVGIVLLFITVATVTLVMVSNPDKNQSIAQSVPPAKTVKAGDIKNESAEVFIAPASTSVKQPNDVVSAGKHHPSLFASSFPASADNGNTETIEEALPLTAVVAQAFPGVPDEQLSVSSTVALPVQHNKSIPANSPAGMIAKKSLPIVTPVKAESFTAPIVNTDNLIAETASSPQNKDEVTNPLANLLPNENRTASQPVKLNRKNKKLSIQAYVTPLISYRDLKENKAFIRAVQTGNLTPMAYTPVPDVKSIVTHKPDMGIQLGVSAGYPLTKGITLIGGLQLTVSKYDIKAYTHPSEITTIALSSAAGGTNTVSTFTNYRNLGGNKADWLRNLYVSAAIPVGLEVKLAGNRKGYVGVAGTLQPTYVLDNRSYLLSTDFKNYAQIPDLIRKVNLNTGFELFVVNNTGKVQWRIGPQVRYQTMSSFVKKYPVEEHLFDFGLKLGIKLR